jgi:hypothetical protein
VERLRNETLVEMDGTQGQTSQQRRARLAHAAGLPFAARIRTDAAA